MFDLGTYILNTELPATELTPRRRGCNGPLDSKNRKFFGRNALQPNAAVHTRHGSIALNLATAGQTDVLSKAHVQVSSRHGKAHVNLVSEFQGTPGNVNHLSAAFAIVFAAAEQTHLSRSLY